MEDRPETTQTGADAKSPETSAAPKPPLSPLVEDLFALAARLILAGVFAFSSIDKIKDPYKFMEKVDEYNILPARLVQTFAMYLPWLMVLGAAALIVGLLARPAAAGIGMMLVSFIIAMAINLVRGNEMDCGCFIGLDEGSGWTMKHMIVSDLAMLALAAYLVLRGGRRLALDHLIPWPGWLRQK